MIYRILKSPPGYPAEQQFVVVAYETLDLGSSKPYLAKDGGGRFAATLDEARNTLPRNAVRLPFEPVNQFLELWKD